jgi:hypothetical protein
MALLKSVFEREERRINDLCEQMALLFEDRPWLHEDPEIVTRRLRLLALMDQDNAATEAILKERE